MRGSTRPAHMPARPTRSPSASGVSGRGHPGPAPEGAPVPARDREACGTRGVDGEPMGIGGPGADRVRPDESCPRPERGTGGTRRSCRATGDRPAVGVASGLAVRPCGPGVRAPGGAARRPDVPGRGRLGDHDPDVAPDADRGRLRPDDRGASRAATGYRLRDPGARRSGATRWVLRSICGRLTAPVGPGGRGICRKKHGLLGDVLAGTGAFRRIRSPHSGVFDHPCRRPRSGRQWAWFTP